jgi:hypothetical protein
MGEAIGWTGIIIALIAAVRGEVAAWTARKSVRDKLEFDSQLQKLKAQHANCAAEAEARKRAEVEMKTDLARCAEQHAESERDRAEMKGRLAVMETLLAQKVQ